MAPGARRLPSPPFSRNPNTHRIPLVTPHASYYYYYHTPSQRLRPLFWYNWKSFFLFPPTNIHRKLFSGTLEEDPKVCRGFFGSCYWYYKTFSAFIPFPPSAEKKERIFFLPPPVSDKEPSSPPFFFLKKPVFFEMLIPGSSFFVPHGKKGDFFLGTRKGNLALLFGRVVVNAKLKKGRL